LISNLNVNKLNVFIGKKLHGAWVKLFESQLLRLRFFAKIKKILVSADKTAIKVKENIEEIAL